MRNPFANLAKRNPAYPSLRERAAALKASAARVIRRMPVDATSTTSTASNTAPALAADSIMAAIAEMRRLQVAVAAASAMPQPAGSIDPLPEQTAAMAASNDHIDNVLLKTVPTTAAGCVALARFAIEFLEDEGFPLDENQSNEQHVRILGLIARSPMLEAAPAVRPFAPDFSGMSARDLSRTYNAFKLASDVMGLAGWAFPTLKGKGHLLLDAEADRLSFLQGYIADELRHRDLPVWPDAADRLNTLIDRAVAVGDYDDAAHFAAEADAKRL